MNASKATQSLPNPTKYFCPGSSRSNVRFPSSSSYKVLRSKRESYETRLYWEYKYCEYLGGQTFFYTLTYNDKSIPKFYGRNCFDYEDLRYLLNGGFKKYLLRNFGTDFKYFVGAELGDGKGSRGVGNNPHYHVLFFLRPSSDPDFYPLYKKIHPVVFRSLIRLYWQGAEFVDYRVAKFGIAKEGRFCGLVKDFRACIYVAKYCTKDAGLKSFEEHLKLRFESKYRFNYADSYLCYQDFLHDVVFPDWNIKNSDGTYFYSYYDFLARFVPDYHPTKAYIFDSGFIPACQDFIKSHSLSSKYSDFVSSKIDEFVRRDINVYRNRYCNKCRISNGVGLYALDCLEDLENPKIKVPSKSGFKYRPLCLYYYRKLFCAYFKDKNGSVIYTLNSNGIDFRVRHLSEYVDSFSSVVSRYLNLIVSSENVYYSFYRSSYNCSCFDDYVSFLRKYNFLKSSSDVKRIVRLYAEFKIIYEDRFFKFDGKNGSSFVPVLSPVDDFRRFLTPAPLLVNRCESSCSHFFEWFGENWLSYSNHPVFYPYCELFSVFDDFSDYFGAQADDEKERSDKVRESVRCFHSKRLFSESL